MHRELCASGFSHSFFRLTARTLTNGTPFLSTFCQVPRELSTLWYKAGDNHFLAGAVVAPNGKEKLLFIEKS